MREKQNMYEEKRQVGGRACGGGGEDEEGTHFALARFFGRDAPALRGR